MSSAPSKKAPSAEPAFDLDYSIHDFPDDGGPDSQYLYARIDDVMVQECRAPGGRSLDVACGLGKLVVNLADQGTESWGLDPSGEMLGLSRWVFPPEKMILLRSIGESLPFRDASFDRISCQGSLDHFVNPTAFIQEATRILKPNGRLVIALANYDSLSCTLGRFRHRVAQSVLRRPPPPGRPYWEIPLDHFHRGDLAFVKQLGGQWLELERCYGISLLWLFRGWGAMLQRLPKRAGNALLSGADRIAHARPGMSDMIISVWRKR